MCHKKSSKVPLLPAGAWPNAIPLTHVVGVRASFHYTPVPDTAGQASKMQESATVGWRIRPQLHSWSITNHHKWCSTSMVWYLKSRYIRMTQGTPTSQTEPKLKGVQGFFCVDTFGLQKVWCLPQCLDSPFDRPAPRFNGAASVAISCQIKETTPPRSTIHRKFSWSWYIQYIYI